MTRSTFDNKAAQALLAQLKAAMEAKDSKSVAALAVPEARDAVGKYYRSLMNAGYVVVSGKLRSKMPAGWDKAPILRSKQFVPPPVAAIDVLFDNPAHYERRESVELGRSTAGEGYVLSFLLPKARNTEGGLLTKDGMDYGALREQVRDAARKAFNAFRKKHPKDPAYAFALSSDDDAMTLVPAFNTDRGLAKRAKRYGYTSEADVNTIRWSPGEWEFEGFGGEHFDAICDTLATVAGERIKGGFSAHKKRVFAAAGDALTDLETAGAFGRGPQRAGLTVYFSITDSDDATRVQRASARRANPKAIYERFLKTGG